MSELVRITDSSLSRLSHTVGRLERSGWVGRTPDPSNGRYMVASLTDAGWEKVVASAPGHVGAAREYVIDRLTAAQTRQLREICDRIVAAIEPETRC